MTHDLFDNPKLSFKQRKETFLYNLKGITNPYKRYLGSPIRYAGGKSLAVGLVIEHFPDNLTRLVSPFTGGSSIEIATALELDIEVRAYDIFDILVNFWQIATTQPEPLYTELSKQPVTKEHYKLIKGELTDHFKGRIKLDPLTLARDYYYNFNLSYAPSFLGWMSNCYRDTHKYTSMLNRLRAFGNRPNISNFRVECQDFRQVLEAHPDDFLYLDPPYFLGSNSKMFKGIYPSRNITIHHNGFRHETLAKMLKAHRGQFVLSYNDCQWVRDAYKGYRILEPKWAYTLGQGETRIGKNRLDRGDTTNIKQSHELLIIKD